MKVILTSDVKHDGKRHKAGDAVDLPTKVAQRLIEVGAAEAPPAAKETKAEREAREKAEKEAAAKAGAAGGAQS